VFTRADPYPESDESSPPPPPHPISLKFIWILSTHIRLQVFLVVRFIHIFLPKPLLYPLSLPKPGIMCRWLLEPAYWVFSQVSSIFGGHFMLNIRYWTANRNLFFVIITQGLLFLIKRLYFCLSGRESVSLSQEAEVVAAAAVYWLYYRSRRFCSLTLCRLIRKLFGDAASVTDILIFMKSKVSG
jgi:hypothetical protein